MAGKKRERYVTVNGVTYAPDDDMPADVSEKVTNPKAFEPVVPDGDGETGTRSAPAPRRAASKGE